MTSVRTKLISQWTTDERAPLCGWDLSYLNGRWNPEPPPWDYCAAARKLLDESKTLLDMGTGGGELLEWLRPLPRVAAATEKLPHRASAAAKRLEPFGVRIFQIDHDECLPFPDEAFDVILNHHSTFVASKVFRVLAKSGAFLSQQAASGNLEDLLRVFGAEITHPKWMAADEIGPQLKAAGYRNVVVSAWSGEVEFADVGAILYFLNAIFPGRFSVKSHLNNLLSLHDRLELGGRLAFRQTKYLVSAIR